MKNENSVVIFSQASKMLAEATTIQRAKELKDLALTASEWAKRKGMGEEAVKYAMGYALDASRRMGELLAETERAKGASAGGKKTSPRGTYREPRDSEPTLAELGISKKESSRAQKLAKLPEEKYEMLKHGELKLYNIDNPHVSKNSGENEWYTPKEIIEAARNTMGSIDTDPATSEKANKTIQAKTYFTIKNSGLKNKWNGNVWMNPPYSQPLVTDFCNTVTEKFISKEIIQACVLVNNATETIFFQNMALNASLICFYKGRIRFIDISGNPSGAPLQGQSIIYFGHNNQRFINNFSKFGFIVETIHARQGKN